MRGLKLVFIFSLFLIIPALLNGQENQIKPSNNKVILDGTEYYIHIVRKGETIYGISEVYKVPVDSILKENRHVHDTLKVNQYLKIKVYKSEQPKAVNYTYYVVQKGDTPFSIAKRFGISIDELYRLNPGSEITIKVGESLKIPASEQFNQPSPVLAKTESQPTEPNENKGMVRHTVEKKQTKFGIASLYGISIAELEACNPGLAERTLQVGEEVMVPVKNNPTTENPDYYFHKVEKQETIFGLCKQYNLKEKELYKHNPELQDKGLQVGELIRIPKKNATQVETVNTTEPKPVKPNETAKEPVTNNQKETIVAPVVVQPLQNSKQNNDCGTKTSKKKVYKIAFFLPLYLNVNDTLGQFIEKKVKHPDGYMTTEMVPREGRIEDKIYPKSELFLQFYQGALLALNDMKKQGFSFDVEVFDTRSDSLYVAELMKSRNFSDFDLFIGPVYSENLNIVADYAWEHQINIVSPLSTKSSFIENNPYAFQVSPPFEVQMKHASDYLNSFDTKNYIVIHDGNNLDQDYLSIFKKQLYSQINENNFDQIKYNEVFYYDARDSVLQNAFTAGMDNIVIIPSSDQSFVSDVMGKLNGYSYHYKIITFGQPRWIRFDNIELDHFHNTNTRIFSNSYVDYQNQDVVKFILQYRKYYKTEPDKFAFQGYDITKYFGVALQTYGHEFRKCIHLHDVELLQTKFNFVPYTDQGGYQNTAIYLLEFTDDYKLIKLAQYPE